MGKNKGFPLGQTLQAKTKGIWIWIGDFFDDPNRALILLDTEGLYDSEKGDASHDMNMFALSLLLSSVFIFNTKGTIDAKSLDGLHYATEISRYISSDSNKNLPQGENFTLQLPSFIWAIRDHHLKLEINEAVVTPKEYLEFCLKTKPGFSNQIIQYNGLRETLRAFFKERNCFVFPPPVTNQDKINHLDTITDNEELSIEFQEAEKLFIDFIKENCGPKMVKGNLLTGKLFGLFTKVCTEEMFTTNFCIESKFQVILPSC
jgi:hypothetical protein